MNDTCDRCCDKALGIGSFASAFRQYAASIGAPPPGNLCGACAANLQVSLLIAEAENYGRYVSAFLDQMHGGPRP